MFVTDLILCVHIKIRVYVCVVLFKCLRDVFVQGKAGCFACMCVCTYVCVISMCM